MPIDKENLLCRLKVDDERALEELFEQYHGKLLQIAVQMLHSREWAEETVMDTFAAIWENRYKLPDIRNLNWYLYSTVRNKCLNQLRSARSRPFVYLEDIEMEVMLDASPEELMISAENMDKINQAINALPPKCRQVFILVKEEQLKYAQVAEILQLSIKTVENQMGIALKKIYQSLRE